MTPQSSAWPAVVDGVLDAFAVSNPGVQRVDGPPLNPEALEDQAIVVGFGAPTAGMLSRSQPDFGGRVTEQGSVVCVISVYSGDGDMAAVRASVMGILSAFEMQLRTDPTLGERIDDCQIGREGEWHQTQTSKGCTCAFGFTVDYTAFI